MFFSVVTANDSAQAIWFRCLWAPSCGNITSSDEKTAPACWRLRVCEGYCWTCQDVLLISANTAGGNISSSNAPLKKKKNTVLRLLRELSAPRVHYRQRSGSEDRVPSCCSLGEEELQLWNKQKINKNKRWACSCLCFIFPVWNLLWLNLHCDTIME